ncbi:MAG: ferredoxin--NADP+ reductase [Planctomycetota bacterium]|jgi:ferredoxin--NADP+ reductase
MARTGSGQLIERQILTPMLGIFRFALDEGCPAFVAGQYLTLGLEVEGEIVWRPYSIASSPEQTNYVEFLVRWAVHPVEGKFTTALGRLEVGDRIRWRGPKGHFTLPDSSDGRMLLLIGAGTGVAPFVSFIRHIRESEQSREIILLHGASYIEDLAYGELFRDMERQATLRYWPTISRPDEDHNRDWRGATGRVESWLERPAPDASCALERALAFELNPESTFVYLCGSIGMAESVTAQLLAQGYRPKRPRDASDSYDFLVEAYG